MVFKCQDESFLKEYTSKVVSCTPKEVTTFVDGKKTKINGYEVICEDTILFPEGGGQPTDFGLMNESKVLHVARKADLALHHVDKPLSIGEEVKQVVDWERRFDHMQQHSGQHLVTAIVYEKFNFDTTSWGLGSDMSYIELDTPSVSEEQIRNTEDICNRLIREGRKVSVIKYASKEAGGKDLEQVRKPRDLPPDVKGEIRVVEIEGVEANMCCGTHVDNISQIQTIKILHCEKSKQKYKSCLYFLAGDRVIKRLHDALQREQKITGLLKCPASEFADRVEKLQKNVKTLTKNLQTVLKESIIAETAKLKQVEPPPKFFTLHKKEAEPDFMTSFIRELGKDEIFLFLSVGDENEVGNIVLYGQEKDVALLGPKVSEILNGKGAGKGNKFQARVNKMSKRSEALKLIEEHFS